MQTINHKTNLFFRVIKYGVLAASFFGILLSCRKDEKQPITSSETSTIWELQFKHESDGNPLLFDTIIYTTQAGQQYSINSLFYYFSRVYLIKPDSSLVSVADYICINARDQQARRIDLRNAQAGNYIGIKGSIGLDSVQNVSDFLPSTVDNINMQWPEPMGGGYHFLKLEGYYKDNNEPYGYAMHLGTNKCLVPVVAYKNFTLSQTSNITLSLVMNVNEWFRNPYTYNFNADGNYIMGNDTAMLKIATNGKDVFTLK